MSDTSNSAVLEAPKGAKLLRQREEAIRFLQIQLERGAAIRAMRIRSAQELDQARSAKLEWTARNTQLLNELFDNSSIADQCNDWVGRIYPEYAEFGNFVETFYAEMDHRIRRLKVVARRLERAEAGPVSPQSAGEEEPAAKAAEPVATKSVPAKAAVSSKITRGLLVICGGSDASKEAVSDLLESLHIEVSTAIGARGISATLDQAGHVHFALILDEQPKVDHAFELGFCAGRLGLNRVILLQTQADDLVDQRGLVHLVMDAGGGWMLQLARHLRRAGIEVDLNQLC